MRNEKVIQKELDKILRVISLSKTPSDEIRLHHINRTLSWVLDLGYTTPSSFDFDDREKFEAAWRPERRVKERRQYTGRPDTGRRHLTERRKLL